MNSGSKMQASMLQHRDQMTSWYEASARTRVRLLLDPETLHEFVGPQMREISPHLRVFDLPEQFDDGIIVGRGELGGSPVFVAAQEGRFMGGAIGEVHGAKLTGLLRAARDIKSVPVLILFDTGGVRLQEANAGEVAVAEIMRAIIEARTAGTKIIGLIGGRAGCYGGGGLIAGCCSALAVSEQGRIAVSGPEVIETNRGVEEFDSRDRALVWRTMGGKHRRLLGGADVFTEDTVEDFRNTAMQLLRSVADFSLATLINEQARLEQRLERFGSCLDAVDVWSAEAVPQPDTVPGLAPDEFKKLVDKAGRINHDAR
ncbi:biotin-independent malonate decarboxylase subunit beta [Phyllobacterium zundukense]|uniref:Biotin-independent malonate decarboxylase subunit beta n=1 Tax=Phyllobacterium zundukense TaxID=1867719 RepID=A0ACD4CY30_9HYPH|nr:biotin-independent malonate decarboxylase subunit beta [Phyllobacterium zundukense]UXN58479.1 biotin-independent malonate decarboxylase subunit beta [Phyllobacterium zundukense]